MIKIRPFRGLRPIPEKAGEIASPPYDVLDKYEARALAQNNPNSFLHVIKPEIDLPDSVDPYSGVVYQKGKQNLERLINDGLMIQDAMPCFYIYKLKMGNHEQVGLAVAASVDDYLAKRIKEHESTRPDKEQDRFNHIDCLNANTGPVFLMYKEKSKITALINEGMQAQADYDFIGVHGVQNTLWVIKAPKLIKQLQDEFAQVEALYVADGHHRAAAAARICELRKKQNPGHTGDEEYNFFLAVIFPDAQMNILEYNRAIADINGYSDEAFIARIKKHFDVRLFIDENGTNGKAYKPGQKAHFGMYFRDKWYALSAKSDTYNGSDPVEVLDVSILQKNLLSPVLGINDPRMDQRICFIGGIRGLAELERIVNNGNCDVAFSMYPTSIEQLIAVADAGLMMPPKSTWFEPKLQSGLLVHFLD